MEVRIRFSSEVYVKGDTLDEIREQWENLPLFTAEAIGDHYAEFIEVESAERVDDDSNKEVEL